MNGVTAWIVVCVAALAMLQLGVGTKMLSLPRTVWRCGACGRLVRRGRVCRCADRGSR
jgi:hypothetical protein